MTRRKWAAAVLTVLLAVTTAMGLASCAPKDQAEQPKEEGPETGVYYYDAGTDEYQIALNNGDAFTFLVLGENKTGTYRLEGEALTLDFAKAEDGEVSATLSSDVLTLTYDGVTMRFLKKVVYTVSYETQGASTMPAASVVNGKTLAKPADPELDGYVFAGWYKDEMHTMPFLFGAEPVTGNMTLYAYWLVEAPGGKEYTVEYDLGYDAAAPEAVQTVGGCVLELPEPEREGYTFLGWYVSAYDDAEKLTYEYTAGTALRENTTLYALWRDESAEGLSAPEVSVSETGVVWEPVSGANVYTVKVSGPNGYSRTYSDLQTTSQGVDFGVLEAGDYEVSVTASGASSVAGDANAVTSTRYYKNKALAGVSFFTVTETSTLIFEGVENAQRYYLTIDCGNKAHEHERLALGNSTNYNFTNCEMCEGGIAFVVTAEADGYAPSVSKAFVYNRELAQVSGLRYDAETETIRWDAVPDAMSYVVSVGDEPKDIGNVTSYSIKGFDAGEVVFSIYPRTKGYNSPAASTLTVEKARLAAPGGLRVEETTLKWDAVTGATGYTVRIDGTEYPVAGTSFDLTDYVSSGEEVTVSVRADGSAPSLWSDETKMSYLAMSGELNYSANVLTWNAVVGATYYEVRVNDGAWTRYEAGVTQAEVKLTQAGENTLYVRYGDADELPSEEASTTVYAYTIEFDMRGGAVAADPLYVAYGDKVVLPEPESAAWEFDGWYNVPGGSASNGAEYTDTVYTERSDLLLYANWHGKTFTVTYDAALGAVSEETAPVVYGESFTLEVPMNTKDRDARYAFVGWYTEKNGTGTRYTDAYGNSVRSWDLAADTTLYASWAEVFEFVPITGTTGEPAYSVQAGPEINAVSEVTIPATYQAPGTSTEYYVTDLLSGAFEDCTSLEEINIPNSIRTVGALSLDDSSGAFADCDNLMNVNVYEVEGSHEVYYYSVDGVLLLESPQTGLTRIAYFPAARTGIYYVPEGVQEIPTRTFAGANLSTVIIPESVLYIRQTAFYNNRNLEQVIFESGSADVQPLLIEGLAFQGCTALDEITLPARLAQVESFDDVFYNCTSLSNIYFEEGNTYYSSVEGLVCDALGETLVFCPYGKSGVLTLPSTLMAIGEYAMAERDNLTGVVIGAYVESIGAHAFEDSSNLRQVTFLGSAAAKAAAIGNYAFYNCTALTTVTFAENSDIASIGDYAFAFCENLGAISIPTSITSIGAYAFQSCFSLSEITIEGGEQEITVGDYAFTECVNLRTVNLEDGVSKFNFTRVFSGCDYIETVNVSAGNSAFTSIDGVVYTKDGSEIVYYPRQRSATEYTLADSVAVIGEGAFQNAVLLQKITIGEKVKTIGASAFANCSSLTALTIAGGDQALSLGASAFSGCANLQSVALPDRIVAVSEYAFAYNTALDEITLGENLESIGSYAFAQTAIEEIDIPDSVSEIGSNAFDSCMSLIRAELPSSMKTVASQLFSNCPSFSEVVIPEGVEAIGESAFADCTALSLVTLPSTLKTIGVCAFINTGIVNLEIPNGVTKIEYGAFANCLSLETLTFEEGGTEPLEIADFAGSVYPAEGAFSGNFALKTVIFPARVKYIGSESFNDCNVLETVKFNTDEEGKSMLESIGDNAFFNIGCKELVFPEGLETIATWAFRAGTAADARLEKVTFPSTITDIGGRSFENQNLIANIEFTPGGQNPLSIGADAFNKCSSLTSIEIPANISADTSLAAAFASCTALATVTLASETDAYVEKDGMILKKDENGEPLSIALYPTAKTGTVTLPEGIKTIEADQFAYSKATEIVLPDTVETIGNYAFQYSEISEITLPASLKTLGTNMFSGCSNLTTVNFDEGLALEALPDRMFYNAEALTEISIPDSVKTLGQYLFYNAPLESITLPENLEVIGKYAFFGTNLTSIDIPASVTEIADYAFSQCTELTTVNFAENAQLETIGQYAFGVSSTTAKYTGLTSIVIPKSVTSIGSRAFNRCEDLTSVTFEAGGTEDLVLADGKGAAQFYVAYNSSNYGVFGYCTSLESVTLPYRLKSVPRDLFICCFNLKEINFETDGNGNYGVTEIGYGAFRETAIESFVVPESVTTLEFSTTHTNNTFAGCEQLKSVTLSAGVEDRTDFWKYFHGSNALEEVNVSENNPGLASQDGVLFSKDLKTLIYFPTGKLAGETYTVPDGTETIGADAFYHYYTTTSSSYKPRTDYARISGVVIPASVSSIGEYAFVLPDLETVTFTPGTGAASDADSLEIGQYAFAGQGGTSSSTVLPQTKLTSITFPARLTSLGNYVFRANKSLTTVSFEDGCLLDSMGTYVFRDCTALKSISLPDSLSAISNYAFYGCTSLASVSLPEELESIGASAFYNCLLLSSVAIPASVESIGKSAFDGCTGLQELTFGENSRLDSIGDSAFYGCELLESIEFPINLTTIGESAFEGCTNLKEVEMRPTLVSLGADAFNGCSALESFTIYGALASVGSGAFTGCGKLDLTVDSNNSSYTMVPSGEGSETGGILYNSTMTEIVSVYGVVSGEIVIPDTVVSIPSGVFAGSKVTKVTLPSGITVIPDSLFENCADLTEVVFNGRVTVIGERAFANSGLKQITIARTVTAIAPEAFQNCANLESLVFEPNGTSLLAIGSSAFENCTALTSVDFPVRLRNVMYDDDNYDYVSGTFGIGASAFEGCTNLAAISFNVRGGENSSRYLSFGNRAFSNTGLTSVTLPDHFGNSGSDPNGASGGLAIGTSCFEGCTALESFTFNRRSFSYYFIGSYAFRGCTLLDEVNNIPSGLYMNRNGSGLFEGCTSLKEISFPLGLFSSVTGIFRNCTALETVNLLATRSTFNIPSKMFEGCTSLKTVIMPDSLFSIAAQAFLNCTGLQTITIPTGINTISDNAFAGCTSLTAINIAEASLMYQTIDGNLYTKDGTQLIRYAPGKTATTFIVPSTVTTIAAGAFDSCKNLTSVTLPASVTTVEAGAFEGWTASQTITVSFTQDQVPSGFASGWNAEAKVVYADASEPAVLPESKR